MPTRRLTLFLGIAAWWFAVPNIFAESSCLLRMGWEQWKPYQYIDENNQLTGVDIELVGAIVTNMGCDIEFVELPWKRHLVEVEKGKTDIAAGASMTAERQEWAYFTQAYREETRVLFVLKGTSETYQLNSLADIIGTFRLGVNSGAYNGEEFAQLIEQAEFKKHVEVVNDEVQNHDKLIGKRINGFIADVLSGTNRLRERNLQDNVEVHPVHIHSDNVYVMFSKQSTTPELVETFNKSLALLKENGVYDGILKKYVE